MKPSPEQQLLDKLCQPDLLEARSRPELVETHISWILLTKSHAYKIKKPVDLGFADFSTLEKRKYYCEEELRLNRRLAPDLYTGVVTITGTPEHPNIDGPGAILEYAVKMIRFDGRDELDKLAEAGAKLYEALHTFTTVLARFHSNANAADPTDRFSSPEALKNRALDNFESLLSQPFDQHNLDRLTSLRQWTVDSLTSNHERFEQRKQDRRVRECHGDLHLKNLVMIDGQITAFDCLEFNEDFRWIDVASELGFLLMDLHAFGRGGEANKTLNWYLEASGDYGLVPLLRHYMVYRALVRAKVSALIETGTKAQIPDSDTRRYLDLAESFAFQSPEPFIVITHGLSGCGKTWIGDRLLELFPFVRLRSDVVRKQIHDLDPLASSASEVDSGIYTKQASDGVYGRLGELTENLVLSGHPVMVDATFLNRRYRNIFMGIARKRGIPLRILSLSAPHDLLVRRIENRQSAGKDASEADLAVLKYQIDTQDPLDTGEQVLAITVDTNSTWARDDIRKLLEKLQEGTDRHSLD